MLIRNAILRAYPRRPADDGNGGGGGGGGGGDGGGKITPEVQALIDAAIDQATTGLKSKNAELLGKLKTSTESLKAFEGIDPVAVRNILKRFSDDEEAAMIAKGEIDKVLERRTERMRTEHDRALKAASDERDAAMGRSKAYESRVLDNAIRSAIASAGLHPHAVDDALMFARTIFTLNDRGDAVQLGDDGKPVFGKDGKTPFAPSEWIVGMKEKKPHWFPAAASGGGAGNGGGGGGGDMTKSARDMTTAEKAAFIGRHGNAAWASKVQADYAKPAARAQ